ncbi:MAG TPA: Uma2 family endonuclease, partial [Ktedonobacteraceae bacterium]|nr:Uma2 family endonuclease [Ktedonobacteraceae bacterium]
KFGFYRECPTIQEYLLIDAQRPMLEVYRREKHDFWILRAYRLDEDVELTNLGVRFAVNDVYEDVIFPPQDESTRL